MGQVVIDQVAFKHDLDAEDLKKALARIEQARAGTNARVGQLVSAKQAGDEFLATRAAAILLTGEDAILASAIKANQKLRARKRRPLEECLALAGSLDFADPFKEPVRIWLKPKASGGYRILYDFGLRHRTAQVLIKRVMDAQFVPRSFQFTHIGIHGAIKRVKALIDEGYVHTAHLDIKNYFGSFQCEELLKELPLHKEVVEHAVTGRHMRMVLDQEWHKGCNASHLPPTKDLTLEARLGIPAGSICSPIVGAFCMSRLQWPAMADVVLLNFADDFLLLAKSQQALAAAVDKLVASVGNLPGGTFNLKLKQSRAAYQGLSFLGHEMQVKDGILFTSPSVAAEGELFRKLAVLDQKLGATVYPVGLGGSNFDKQAALRLLARQYALLEGWRAAFKECDSLDELTEAPRLSILNWLQIIDVSIEEVAKAVTPDMKYEPDVYALGK